MRTLVDIVTRVGGERDFKNHTVAEVRKANPVPAESFENLVELLSELAYHNPHLVMAYRGQTKDYCNSEGLTSLLPSVYRHDDPKASLEYLEKIDARFCGDYTYGDSKRLSRSRLIRWALMQHYGVCKTPLLDLTLSLRVAASFARPKGSSQGYLFVLGLPHIGGSVTVSADQELEVIRLLSQCPPEAARPNFQEGYLLGEYPPVKKHDLGKVELSKLDCAHRLLCKFDLRGKSFWDEFQPISSRWLFPEKDIIFDHLNNMVCRWGGTALERHPLP